MGYLLQKNEVVFNQVSMDGIDLTSNFIYNVLKLNSFSGEKIFSMGYAATKMLTIFRPDSYLD